MPKICNFQETISLTLHRILLSLIAVKKFFLLILFCAVSFFSRAQSTLKDSSFAFSMVGTSYSFELPGGDLAKRFGYNSSIGVNFLRKTKHDWVWGADANFLFGNQLKETGILDSIKTAEGHIINQNGEYAEIRMFERGMTSTLKFGKMLHVLAPTANSGIILLGSAGFMLHKIRIEDIGNASPQLSKEMKKGYDRLTNGFCTSEFIGYMYIGKKKTVNFFAGLEFYQGFTEGRRKWDYDLMRPDSGKRLDLLYGIRAGWILPLYKRTPDLYYFY